MHPGGFYAWRLNPDCCRAREYKRLLVPIKQSWRESGSVYGYRKVRNDLRKLGEQCDINRIHRLMRVAGIRLRRATPSASTNAAVPLRWWRALICSATSMCRSRIAFG